jgi:allantoinase
MFDLIVLGGTVVSSRGRRLLDLGIADGRIAGVFAPGTAPDAKATVEADGLLVLPGIVDAHFHCFAPGHAEREDFESGTRAAAAGGVTTLLEMPISTPGVHNGEVLRQRRLLGEQQAHVDFGLWGGGGAESEADIQSMAAEGAVGYKIFMYEAPAGRDVEFRGLTAPETGALYQALRWIGGTGLPAAIHCEDADMIRFLIAELRAAGHTAPEDHTRSRPDFVEAIAVSKVLLIAEALGTRVHFPHISSARALAMLAEAKQRGLAVSVETCPHYLFADESALTRLGPYARINPPLRSGSDADALWDGVLRGTVDIVASDHAPYTPEEKESGWQDIFACSAGAPGVETMGPAIWDRALSNDLSFERAVEVLSERPARLFGLDQKGTLAPGGDADFVLLDPSATWTVKTEHLQSRSKQSARLFAGRTFKGQVVATYSHGAAVFRSGSIESEPGQGRFVRPA